LYRNHWEALLEAQVGRLVPSGLLPQERIARQVLLEHQTAGSFRLILRRPVPHKFGPPYPEGHPLEFWSMSRLELSSISRPSSPGSRAVCPDPGNRPARARGWSAAGAPAHPFRFSAWWTWPTVTASILVLILLIPGGLQGQHAPQLVQGGISDPDRLALNDHPALGEYLAPTSVKGQGERLASSVDTPRPDEVDVAWLWTGGIVGGAAGLGLGILIGLEVHPSVESPFLGGLAGYTVGVPIGVHLANQRRGNPWLTGLASALPMTTFLLVGYGETALIAAAAVQLVGSAAVERYGERRRGGAGAEVRTY